MVPSLYFLILNMNKNPERYENIKKMLDALPGCNYYRVEAVDGYHMDQDKDTQRILQTKPELLGKTFYFKNFNQTDLEEWVYDGTIETSFPGLSLTSYQGAKGLVISNLKAFEIASLLPYSWYCILEDDAEIDIYAYTSILKLLHYNHQKIDMVLLDKRGNGFGGTAGILYKSSIIKQVYKDLNPLSEFSITLEDKTTFSTLWDWKLWQYLKLYKIKYLSLPCIGSGKFESTISPPL